MLTNACCIGMTLRGPQETWPVSLVPCRTCWREEEATLVGLSRTQTETRWICHANHFLHWLSEIIHACGSFTDSNGDQVDLSCLNTNHLSFADFDRHRWFICWTKQPCMGGGTPAQLKLGSPDTVLFYNSSWHNWNTPAYRQLLGTRRNPMHNNKRDPFPSPQTSGTPLPRPLMGARAASLPLTFLVTGGQFDGSGDDPTDQVRRSVNPNQSFSSLIIWNNDNLTDRGTTQLTRYWDL